MSTFLDREQERESDAPPSAAAATSPFGFGSAPRAAWEVQRDKPTVPGQPGDVIGVAEGKPRAEYFQTARMANDPTFANANDQPTDIMGQAGTIPALLEAQKNAREGGRHREYQAKRTKFEHEVGLLAAEDPHALGTMQAMCDKARDWIAIMGGGQDAYAALAQDSKSGYGGAVGVSTDPKDPANAGVSAEELEQRKQANAQMMQTIMGGGGNIREMAMALQNFQTMMAKDLQDPEKRKKLEEAMAARKLAEAAAAKPAGEDNEVAKPASEVAANAERQAASLSAGELQNIMGRFDQTKAGEAGDAHGAAKAMFSPTGAEKAADGRHAQFGGAKKEDHDTKLPPMPKEAVDATRALQRAQDSVDRLTTRITSLTGQKTAAQQAASAADAQVARLEGAVASAPPEGKAAAQQQLTAARSALVAKQRELQRLDGELERAKSDLETARGQLTQARVEAAQPSDPGGKSTKSGEKSPMAWSTEKVEERTEVQPNGETKTVHVSETGIKLSANEVAAMKRNKDSPDTLPMIEGMKANIIDSSQPFISEANAADMPLKSGISGTTFRFMEMAELMGQPPENARLAMIGHLTPIGAHSIHEINTAASGFGGKDADKDGKADAPAPGQTDNVAYDSTAPNAKGGPYTPEKMKPLTHEQLNGCALKAGFASLAEANTPPPDADVASAPKPGAAA